MKKTVARLVCTSSIILFTATLVHAAEQKTVFNSETVKYKSGTGSERCQDKCSKKSGPDAKSLLSEGWKIVSSSPKEVIGEDYWFVPCNSCEPHGCNCIGTEYVLKRDLPTPKVETSKNELELLKNENQQLKREITVLKQENENLKNQIKSK